MLGKGNWSQDIEGVFTPGGPWEILWNWSIAAWILRFFSRTCKVAVSGPTASKTPNQLAIGLEGEDTARFVVHHNDMSIPVHSHSFGSHEAASSNLGL